MMVIIIVCCYIIKNLQTFDQICSDISALSCLYIFWYLIPESLSPLYRTTMHVCVWCPFPVSVADLSTQNVIILWQYTYSSYSEFALSNIFRFLTGTARTSLVVTVGPSPRHRGETASTIMFGQRVRFLAHFDFFWLSMKLVECIIYLFFYFNSQLYYLYD